MLDFPEIETDLDSIPLSFGKWFGTPPKELLESDPHYIMFLYESIDRDVVSEDLYMKAVYKKEELRELEENQFSIY